MAGLVLFRSFPLKLDRLTIVSTSKLAFSTNNSEKKAENSGPLPDKLTYITQKLIEEETKKLDEFFRNLQKLPENAQNQMKLKYPYLGLNKKPHFAPPQTQSQKAAPVDVIQQQKLMIDYRNIELLSHFLSESGKIMPRRFTNLSIANQTRLAKAVKRARHFGLIPYTSKHQDFSHEYKLLSNLKNIKDGESIKDLVENQT